MHVGQRRDFVLRVDHAGRVGRIVEQEHLRLLRQRGVELGRGQLVVLRRRARQQVDLRVRRSRRCRRSWSSTASAKRWCRLRRAAPRRGCRSRAWRRCRSRRWRACSRSGRSARCARGMHRAAHRCRDCCRTGRCPSPALRARRRRRDRPGRKFGTPIEKLMMSRPSALSRLAFSATTMIALGLARPMRRASSGIARTSSRRGERRSGDVSPRRLPETAGRKPEMLAQGMLSAAVRRPAGRGFSIVFVLLLLIVAALPGCMSTQVRQVEDEAGRPVVMSGTTVVLVEPDIELYAVGAGGMAEPRKAWTEAARKNFPDAARQRLEAVGFTLKPDFYLPKDEGPENHLRPAVPAEPGRLDQHPELRPARRAAQQARQVRLDPRSGRGRRCAKPPARTTPCSPTSATATPAAGARRCA